MKTRTYRGDTDVALLQAFNSESIAATGGCGYIHPGDIPHRLFNGNKLFEPSEVLTIWEDGAGVAAWVLASPRYRGYDAQVRPDLRGPGFEREVLEYADARTVELMRRHGIEGETLVADAFRRDTVRAELLIELGWERADDPPYVINRAPCPGPSDPVVPDGYALRAVAGVEEAAALAEVHAASFGSTWTPEMYEKVMRSPGYAPEREFVAEAADGTLAAFTVTWHDISNRTGLFEPVGTHHDHRRRGLGRALLQFGLRAMAAAGMEHATVMNEGTNEPSAALYRSAGFTPWHLIDDYSKPLATGA